MSTDGSYMMEIDRVLRPGGYFVLSGHLEEEQKKIEEIAKLVCWEKKHEKGEMVIWRKRVNNDHCQERESRFKTCESTSVNDIWYITSTTFQLLIFKSNSGPLCT